MKLASRRFSIFFIFSLVFVCLNAPPTADAKAAVFSVTNLNDGGAGSLRQAITDASNTPGEHIINFQPGLAGSINLASALPTLSFPVTINGPGADLVGVRRDAGAAFRVFQVASSVVLNGLAIVNGRAPNSSSDPKFSVGRGGGIFNQGSLTLNNCRVDGNVAFGAISEGGGIYNTGLLTLTNSDLMSNGSFSNGSPAGWQYGGAIFNLGTVIIEGGTISGTSGTTAIHNERTMRISRSAVTNSSGRGVYTGSPNSNLNSLFIENTTISGNQQGVGHGAGTLEIRSSTIVNNLFIGINPSGSPSNLCRLYSSIVAGHSLVDVNGNLLPESSYNLIGNGTNTNLVNGQNGNLVGTSQAPIDPQLAPLGNYGGRTQTHRLLNTSPAINAGNPTEFLTTDQRGVARPVGGSSDIGAFEFNLTPHRYLPRGGLNAGYDQTFTAFSNAPEPVFSFAVTEGALPPGLSLSQTGTNTAKLFGIPADVGTFNFTITATNTEGFTVSASYTLIIQAGISFAGVRGRVLSADGKPVRRAFVLLLDANGNVIKQTLTNPFGYYRFFGIQTGEAYSFKVIAKNRRFTQQNIIVNGELNDFNFIAEP